MEAGHLGSSPTIAIDLCDPEGISPYFWASDSREALSTYAVKNFRALGSISVRAWD